ncbi:MAG: bifunctional demethylmenaquinone methyltransferase/2-methoxy-6-polyprenyl-1,4-benzoquinol methylase UbiE [Actinomycetia bacterium]|nr:bifunctional demethylmenaquinone methyltransferase/2-methoxy-6-polyprenyl-1,4-benzoquinol methylase UbiE [Actinomycetes bacterium]
MNKDKVSELFDSISGKYDITNSIISLGLESIWRRQFLRRINSSDSRILDICCGTGTSTYQIWLKAGSARVSGIDFSDGMIDIAKSKYKENTDLVFYSSDASDLDFADNAFDCITIVFGIRNILKRKKALKEFYRVTKHSGRIIILEFNYIEKGSFSYLFRFYLSRIMPFVGGFITGDRWAYRYLAGTIKEFPDPENFKRLMENAGWESVQHLPLTMSICNIFTGYKGPVRELGSGLQSDIFKQIKA